MTYSFSRSRAISVDEFVEAGDCEGDIIYECFLLNTAAARVVFGLCSGI
jgi:hypothetical protein